MPTDNPKGYGYYIIDPGLALPKYALDPDAQVRRLSYLLTIIPEVNLTPQAAKFKIVPDEYLGGPYPAIGMYTEMFVDTAQNLTQLSFTIGDQLASFILETGIERLLELSSKETLVGKTS